MKHQEKITEVTDEQLLALIDSKETGVSFPDALRALPTPVTSEDDTRVLKSVWDMHGNLMREAHNISPSSALLSRILELAGTVTPTVTESEGGGYIKKSGNTQPNTIPSLILGMNWKIAAPIAVIMIAVVSVLGGTSTINTGANPDEQDPLSPLAVESASRDGEEASLTTFSLAGNDVAGENVMVKSQSVETVESGVAMRSMAVAPRAMGTAGIIDDFAASIVLEADGDMTLLADSTGDIALIAADSQSINEFNTAYDETTF